jgi:hypothetical protein
MPIVAGFSSVEKHEAPGKNKYAAIIMPGYIGRPARIFTDSDSSISQIVHARAHECPAKTIETVSSRYKSAGSDDSRILSFMVCLLEF